MHLDKYEEATKEYFGESSGGKETAQQILLEIFQKSADKNLKAKAAYFLGAIHLTYLLQKSGEKNNSSKEVIISQGLGWFKKSHKFGNKEATLLLGKIYSCEGKEELEKLEVVVAGKSLGKITFYDGYLIDSIYATEYLVAMGNDKEAIALLHKFAVQFLVVMDEIIFGNGKRLVKKHLPAHALKPFFNNAVDLRYQEVVLKLAKGAKQTIESEGGALPVPLFIASEPYADEGAYHALDMFYGFHTTKTVLYTSDYKGPRKDPEKVKGLDQQLWQRRLSAFKTAIQWLDNGKELTCHDGPSELNIELYRLNTVYIEARLAGVAHEAALKLRDEAVNKKQNQISTLNIGSAKIQFFSASNPATLYQNGHEFIKQKDFEKAELVLNQVLSEFSKVNAKSLEVANCHLALAQCYKNLGKTDFGMRSCDKAIELFKTHQQLEQIKTAIELYQTCLEISKLPIMVLLNLQVELIHSRKFHQAKIVLTQLYRRTALEMLLPQIRSMKDMAQSELDEIQEMDLDLQENLLEKAVKVIEARLKTLKARTNEIDFEIKKAEQSCEADKKEYLSADKSNKPTDDAYFQIQNGYLAALNSLMKEKTDLQQNEPNLVNEQIGFLKKIGEFRVTRNSLQEKRLKNLQEMLNTLSADTKTKGPRP